MIILLGYKSHVKRDITHRERVPLGQFTATAFEMANELSLQYKEEEKFINNEPIITTELWKKAAMWAKDSNIPTIKAYENGDEIGFYAPSTKWLESREPFALAAVEKLQAMVWKSFDQYIQFGHLKFYTVRIANDKEKWHLNSQCDCPDFFKHYVCKHSIGIALRRKIAILP